MSQNNFVPFRREGFPIIPGRKAGTGKQVATRDDVWNHNEVWARIVIWKFFTSLVDLDGVQIIIHHPSINFLYSLKINQTRNYLYVCVTGC